MNESIVSRHKETTKTRKKNKSTAIAIGTVGAILFLIIGGTGSYAFMKDNQAKHITNTVRETISVDLDKYLSAYGDELTKLRSSLNDGSDVITNDEKDVLSYKVEHVVTNDLVKHVQKNKEDTLNQMEFDIARIVRANMQRLTEEEQERLIKEVSTIVEAELYKSMLDYFASQKDLTALDARVTKNTTDILNLKESTEDNFSETNSQISELKNALDTLKQESNKTNQDTNSAFENLKTNINNIIAAYKEAFSKDMTNMHDEMDKEFAEDQSALDDLSESLVKERAERIDADNNLTEALGNERKERIAADNDLDYRLDGYDERIGTNRIWSGTRSEYKKKGKTPKTISFISED